MISGYFRATLAGFILVCSLPSHGAADDTVAVRVPTEGHQREALGYIERIKILPENLDLEAKLAPELGTSAMHAEAVKTIKRDGKEYVSFEIEDRLGKKMTLERPLLGSKKTVTAGGSRSRKKVVKVKICLAHREFEAEVLLSDRSVMEQELRIGRDLLAGNFLIDPSKTHSTKAECRTK